MQLALLLFILFPLAYSSSLTMEDIRAFESTVFLIGKTVTFEVKQFLESQEKEVAKPGSSNWLWIGIGCAVLILLGVVVFTIHNQRKKTSKDLIYISQIRYSLSGEVVTPTELTEMQTY